MHPHRFTPRQAEDGRVATLLSCLDVIYVHRPITMGVAGDSKERACWVHEDAAHGIIGRAEVAHRCSRAAIVQFWDGEAERRRRMLYVHMLILADQMSSGVPGRE